MSDLLDTQQMRPTPRLFPQPDEDEEPDKVSVPETPPDNRSNVTITQVGAYSITHPMEAELISRIIISYFPEQQLYGTLCDCTAGNGGNALSFANYFERLILFEISQTEFNALIGNIASSPRRESIMPIQGNFMLHLTKFHPAVVFLDPPWGGPEYKRKSPPQVHLYMDAECRVKVDLINILSDILSAEYVPPILALKLPFNVDAIPINELARSHRIRCDWYHIYRHQTYERPTYLLAVLSNLQSQHPLRAILSWLPPFTQTKPRRDKWSHFTNQSEIDDLQSWRSDNPKL